MTALYNNDDVISDGAVDMSDGDVNTLGDNVDVVDGVIDKEVEVKTTYHWCMKDRNVPSKEDYPLMHVFGIPGDNLQTVQALLSELIDVSKLKSDNTM